MRIIGGKYRGKKLISPDDRVRPTTDMVKENIFNIIAPYIKGCKFLDLFAGSGAIGLEALSRGADNVVFVDKDRSSLDCVRKNASLIGLEAKTINADYSDALINLKNSAFDVIFIDAPYDMTVIDEALRAIDSNGVLKGDGIVVYESLYKTNRKSAVNAFELLKTRKYGTVAVDIYGYKLNGLGKE